MVAGEMGDRERKIKASITNATFVGARTKKRTKKSWGAGSKRTCDPA